MLFTGHSEHTIDPKQRVAIPARYRNQWDSKRDGDAWFCRPWEGRCLVLYTEGRFSQLAEQRAATLTPEASVADEESALYGNTERLELDSAGRLTLPKRHMDLCGLKAGGDVLIVGAGYRLEIWDPGMWAKVGGAGGKK